ncbi:uncharacterized protein BX664DRAFT_331257 [Halteromyces radiatus]|uniref:uncharacterized protein n=1 Tax=Halteromyces radiatus TaxID=101107 RepID=UPI002220F4DA|nr:uncharacterized protein BX664DRAFT_331257 [Halteromyces radiatus]KAI8088738.1 hypothetical protein BX664DRAFT_331257 [Halteromyces radiatus]
MDNIDATLVNDSQTIVDNLDIRVPENIIPPTEEKTPLEREVITDLEKEKNPEWFMVGKPAKTPQKYLLIRNFILDNWHQTKPKYVSKSALRKKMTNCGDVNSFGRVHAFLESHGYINVGCPVPTRPIRTSQQRKPRAPRPPSTSSSSTGKKRKERRDLETWGGFGFTQQGTKSRRRINRPRYNDNGNGDGENDPYQLVHLEDYTTDDEYPPPFKVMVKSDALAIMDFHSHLVMTEIIGLMGGTFEIDENGQKTLTVECVFPCKSTSTDIQCEMDPVSEMEAREWFDKRDLKVVGWYHSHPSFVAIPSIRDIETQMSYQDLFRINETDEPFIGVIVSPYDDNQDHSTMTYLHISNKVDPTLTYRLPYTCDTTIIPSILNVDEVLRKFEQLVEEYKDHQEKVDMSSKINGQLGTEVCLASLERFVHLESTSTQEFLDQVRQLVNTQFLQLHRD